MLQFDNTVLILKQTFKVIFFVVVDDLWLFPISSCLLLKKKVRVYIHMALLLVMPRYMLVAK